MFLKEKKKSFESKNYKMKSDYNTADLVVANLQYVSNEETLYGPMVQTTNQRYIFEKVDCKGKVGYREVFTGFRASLEKAKFFSLPYMIDVVPLREEVPEISNNVSKYGLLLVVDEINTKKVTKSLKKEPQ